MKQAKLLANIRIISFVLLIFVLFLLPLVAPSFVLTIFARYMYFGLLTISFAFLAGQLGLFSLGVPVSFCITAYTIAICQVRNIMPVMPSVFLGILIAMAFAALCGVMVNSAKDISFLMLTLVLSQLVWSLAAQWTSLTNSTTGLLGIRFPDMLNIFGDKPEVNKYCWIVIVFSVCVVLVFILTHSSFGLRLRGIRESESRMILLGYNTKLLKWIAWMISSLISSVSGILFIYYTGMITPDSMSLNAANQALISSILGGVNSIVGGSMIGTVINRTLEMTLSGLVKRYAILVGTMFLLVILVIPDGLTSIFARIKIKFMKDSAAGAAGPAESADEEKKSE
jgi:branched-chain amino acid transport system permease protein